MAAPTPPTRRPIEPGPATLSLAARRLTAAGFPVELHGTVVQPSGRETTAGLFVLSACIGLLGLLAPYAGMALAGAAIVSAVIDFSGGYGPFRALIPRHAHRNLWIGAPTARGTPPDHHLLLVVPDDIARGPGNRLEVIAHGACLSATLLLLPLGIDHPVPRVVLFSLALVQLLIGFGIRLKRNSPAESSGGASLAERLFDLSRAAAPHLHVSVAVIGGMWPWMDGLETLLLNHRPRLDPRHTLIFCWTPQEGPLRARSHEGLWNLRPAATLLATAVREAGVPTTEPRRDPSPAGRAASLGWRAMGIEGAHGDPGRLAESFSEIAARLDRAAGEGKW
jgi:hypothetical protein